MRVKSTVGKQNHHSENTSLPVKSEKKKQKTHTNTQNANAWTFKTLFYRCSLQPLSGTVGRTCFNIACDGKNTLRRSINPKCRKYIDSVSSQISGNSRDTIHLHRNYKSFHQGTATYNFLTWLLSCCAWSDCSTVSCFPSSVPVHVKKKYIKM